MTQRLQVQRLITPQSWRQFLVIRQFCQMRRWHKPTLIWLIITAKWVQMERKLALMQRQSNWILCTKLMLRRLTWFIVCNKWPKMERQFQVYLRRLHQVVRSHQSLVTSMVRTRCKRTTLTWQSKDIRLMTHCLVQSLGLMEKLRLVSTRLVM